jgi:hypothetical protein
VTEEGNGDTTLDRSVKARHDRMVELVENRPSLVGRNGPLLDSRPQRPPSDSAAESYIVHRGPRRETPANDEGLPGPLTAFRRPRCPAPGGAPVPVAAAPLRPI